MAWSYDCTMDLRGKELNDDFEVFANWWLPGSSGERLPGILRFSQERGATLSLQGIFGHESFALKNVIQGPLPKFDAILGEQPNGDQLTLHQVTCSEISGGKNTSEFWCRVVLSGGHVDTGSKFELVSAMFEFDNLESWSCFRLVNSINDESYSFPRGPVTLWSVPESAFHPKITFTAVVSHRLAQEHAAFERRVWITYERRGLTLDEILALANHTSQILSVLMGRPTSLRKCVYVVDGSDGDSDRITTFFKRARITKQAEHHEFNMPFSLNNLGDRVGGVFSKWFESIPEMQIVYSVFFSTLFNEMSYVDVTFQSFVHALEGFHRKTRDGRYLSESEYEAVRVGLDSAIPRDVQAGLKEKLKSSIKYGNEYSLRKRLKELLGSLQEETLKSIKLNNSFVSDVVDTRNYYAHLEESLRTRFVGNGQELYRLNQQLRALFTILVVMRLGIPEQEAAMQIASKMHLEALESGR